MNIASIPYQYSQARGPSRSAVLVCDTEMTGCRKDQVCAAGPGFQARRGGARRETPRVPAASHTPRACAEVFRGKTGDFALVDGKPGSFFGKEVAWAGRARPGRFLAARGPAARPGGKTQRPGTPAWGGGGPLAADDRVGAGGQVVTVSLPSEAAAFWDGPRLPAAAPAPAGSAEVGAGSRPQRLSRRQPQRRRLLSPEAAAPAAFLGRGPGSPGSSSPYFRGTGEGCSEGTPAPSGDGGRGAPWGWGPGRARSCRPGPGLPAQPAPSLAAGPGLGPPALKPLCISPRIWG